MASEDDEFGLSSGDEEELMKLDIATPPLTKRKCQNEDREDEKIKIKREERNEEPSELKRIEIKIKFEGQDAEPTRLDRIPIKAENEDDEKLNATPKPGNVLSTTAAIEIANRILTERFRLSSSSLKREDVIVRLLQGDSAVVVSPTGGEDSLYYQVPAMCFKELDKLAGIRQDHAEGGITLVVSPFLTWMKDQAEELRVRGINAAVLNSPNAGEDWLVRFREDRKAEYRAVIKSMLSGTLDILYVTPERLTDESFQITLANVKGGVRLLAIDEAHRASELGHHFSPNYLAVARCAKNFTPERIVCLTTTATSVVAKSICKTFGIDQTGLFTASTVRANLKLKAMSFSARADSYPALEALLKARPGPTIIFVSNRQHAEELVKHLRPRKFKVDAFNDGMQPEDRSDLHEKFMLSNDLIIVTSRSFHGELVKADVRNIIHYDIPHSLESYSRDIGLAGRDGLESQCMMFLCGDELRLRESMAYCGLPSRTAVLALLQRIFAIVPSGHRHPTIQARSHDLREGLDIPAGVIDNVWAQLESRFGLVKSTTPTHVQYRWKVTGRTLWDKSPAAIAINGMSKLAKVWTYIDLAAATQLNHLPRDDIVRKLYYWHDSGDIDLQPQLVIDVLHLSQNWPPSAARIAEIFHATYQNLEVDVQQELRRMRQVTDLVTGQVCFSRVLAAHFGDSLPERKCGSCTWCETRVAVQHIEPPEIPWDSAAFYKVLDTVPARDDPSYLARVAFGISSSRVRAEKFDKNPVFGSMKNQRFLSLLKGYQTSCTKDESKPARGPAPGPYVYTPTPPPAPKKGTKRTLSRSTSTSSYLPKPPPKPTTKRTFGRSASANLTGNNPYRPGSGAWYQHRKGNPDWR